VVIRYNLGGEEGTALVHLTRVGPDLEGKEHGPGVAGTGSREADVHVHLDGGEHMSLEKQP
jgi:hypothetical protein